MSIQTRSGDLQRLEETIRKAIGDVITRLNESDRMRNQADRRRDQTLEELQDGFVALNVRHTELRAKLQADAGGDSSPGSIRFNALAQYQSKDGFPIYNGNNLNGSGTGAIVSNQHLQMVAQNRSGDLQKSPKEFVRTTINELLAHLGDTPQVELIGGDTFVNSAGSDGRRKSASQHLDNDHCFTNPLAELRRITQTGTVSNYHNRFEMLLAKVNISEHYTVSLFVGGLKDYIRKSVRLFTPKSLAHALALAKLQESSLRFRENSYENGKESMLLTPVTTPHSMNLPDNESRGVPTSIEFDEKKNLGKEESVKKVEEVRMEETEKVRMMNLKEWEFPLVGSYESKGSTHKSKSEQNLVGDPGADSLSQKKINRGCHGVMEEDVSCVIKIDSHKSSLNEKEPEEDIRVVTFNKINKHDGGCALTFYTINKHDRGWLLQEEEQRIITTLNVFDIHNTNLWKVPFDSYTGYKPNDASTRDKSIHEADESATRKIGEPMHRTERIFSVVEGVLLKIATGMYHNLNLKDKVRLIFTVEPGDRLKLWKLRHYLHSASLINTRSYDMCLIAEYASALGKRIICPDASFDEELIVCGDIQLCCLRVGEGAATQFYNMKLKGGQNRKVGSVSSNLEDKVYFEEGRFDTWKIQEEDGRSKERAAKQRIQRKETVINGNRKLLVAVIN